MRKESLVNSSDIKIEQKNSFHFSILSFLPYSSKESLVLPPCWLWNLVKEIADHLTIFEGRTPEIRSNDIVNSWQVLLSLPDKPPALAAMVKEVQERIEDLLYHPVSALERSETASRYAT